MESGAGVCVCAGVFGWKGRGAASELFVRLGFGHALDLVNFYFTS